MKHDDYVDELEDMISGEYDEIIKDVRFDGKKCAIGQVDLIGIKDGRCDIFEVKCSYRFHKAKKQLKRAKSFFERPGKLFFYCGSSGQLMEICA